MKEHSPLLLFLFSLSFINVLSCDPNCENCDQNTLECLRCFDGYALEFDQCISCININCLECLTDANECTKCQNGWVVDTTGSCVECLVPFCLECEFENKCKTCEVGYLENSLGECKICMEGCLNCEVDSVCEFCKVPGYSYEPFFRTCLRCNIDKCIYCYENDKCGLCEPNNTLNLNCTPCQILNCEACYIDNLCIKCNINYQLMINNTCISCPPTLNCIECKNDNVCKTCFPGFTNNNGFCIRCLINKCSNCFPENICTSCEGGLTLSNNKCFICEVENCIRCQLDNNCEECTSPIYTLSSGICNLCTLDNCTECNETNYCVSCSATYSPFLGICYLCEESSNCLNNLCFADNKCLSCKEEYNMFEEECVFCSSSLNCDGCLADGSCENCKTGYLMYQNLCIECGVENCKYCTLPNKCKICQSGFTLINNKCLPCGNSYCTHCKSCSDNNSSCLECTLLKYLSNGACLSSCDIGYYADNLTCTCKVCNESCLSCFGPSSTQCLSCTEVPTYYQLPNSDTCISECPSKTYTDELTKKCVECHESCVACINGSECEVIKNETVFFEVKIEVWPKNTSLLVVTLRFGDGLSTLSTEETLSSVRVLFMKSASRRLLSETENLKIVQISISFPNTITILTSQPNNFQSIVLSNCAIQILLQATLLSANGFSYVSNSEVFNLDDPYFSGSFYRYFGRSFYKNMHIFGYFAVVFALLLYIVTIFISGTSSKLFHEIMEFVLIVQCLGFLRLRWGSSNLGVFSFLDGFSQMELLFIPPVLSWGFPAGYSEDSYDSAAFVWGNHNFIQQMSSIILVFSAFQLVLFSVFVVGKLRNWWIEEKHWNVFMNFEKGLIELFVMIGIFYSTISFIGLSKHDSANNSATFIVCQTISCIVLIVSLLYIFYNLRAKVSEQFYKISCVVRVILLGCFCLSFIPIIVLICLFEVALALIESFLFWNVKMDLKGFVLCKILMICCLAVGGTVDNLNVVASVLSILIGIIGIVKGKYLVIEIIERVKNRKIGDKSSMDVSSSLNDDGDGDNKQIDVKGGGIANNESRQTVIVDTNAVFTDQFQDLKYRNGIEFESESQCEIADHAIVQNETLNEFKQYKEGPKREKGLVEKVEMQNENKESLYPASITKLQRRKRRVKKEEETSQIEELNIEEEFVDSSGWTGKEERKSSKGMDKLEVSFDEEMDVEIMENVQFDD